MEDLLYCKDAYEPLIGTKPAETLEDAWKVSNRKTIALIRQWVDDSVFHHISTETDAKALWEKLESMYERKTAQNKAFLIRKLVNMKY
jgi:gag-polypeptide of LTR copia-type